MSDELSWYLEPPESAGGRPLPTPPTYRPPSSHIDRWAVAAAATGALPLLPPLGIVLGARALARIRRSGHRGAALARAGLIGGIAWTVLFVAAVGFVLWRQQQLAAVRDPAGTVVTSGRVATSDVRVGDCLPATIPPGASRWVQVSSCASVHQGEVYEVRAIGGTDYPGADALRQTATAECAVAWHDGFSATVRAAAASAAGGLAVLVPTEAGWHSGDRGIVCVLTTGQRTGVLAQP